MMSAIVCGKGMPGNRDGLAVAHARAFSLLQCMVSLQGNSYRHVESSIALPASCDSRHLTQKRGVARRICWEFLLGPLTRRPL